MKTANMFNQGWADKLAGRSPPAEYERMGTLSAAAYERGRHAAALWIWYCASGRAPIVAWDLLRYADARKLMPVDLKHLIDKERVFCSIRPRKPRNPRR